MNSIIIGRKYEEFCLGYHRENYNENTRLWNDVPEIWLYESGYVIGSFKQLRKRRKEIKKELNKDVPDQEKLNILCDYGIDAMSKSDENTFDAIQMKYRSKKMYTCRRFRYIL